MQSRPIKIPGKDHPISITPSAERVTVRFAGQIVADSQGALSLKEGLYPIVYYIPLEDVSTSSLQPSSLRTYCPYKGECEYFNLVLAGVTSLNAAWSYAAPFPSVERIAGHVAFYPDRVDSILLTGKPAAT